MIEGPPLYSYTVYGVKLECHLNEATRPSEKLVHWHHFFKCLMHFFVPFQARCRICTRLEDVLLFFVPHSEQWTVSTRRAEYVSLENHDVPHLPAAFLKQPRDRHDREPKHVFYAKMKDDALIYCEKALELESISYCMLYVSAFPFIQ